MLFVGLALIVAITVGGLCWWVLGKATTAEFARSFWRWLTPGWAAWGRFGLALVASFVVAYLIFSVGRLLAASPTGSRRPRKWALLPTVVGAVSLGLMLVGVGYVAITHTLHADASSPPTRIDVLKTALTAVAGVGGAVALVVAYRRQHDLEQGRFIERFGAAAAQLGNPDPAVRIAGIYALASAADEATEKGRRQQCIDVLCGYLRLPYDPDRGGSHHTEIVTALTSPTTAVIQTGREITLHQKLRQNDREVRQTVMRVIAAHLRPDTDFGWSNYDFDFTGVVFEQVSLQSTTFAGQARFDNATFAGECNFDNSIFSNDAHFSNAKFHDDAHFDKTTFCGDAYFDNATFKGDALFKEAAFTRNALFKDAAFSRNALFLDATFKLAVVFATADFTHNAVFTGTTFPQEAVFTSAEFTRNAWFNKVKFVGEARFNSANFSRTAGFNHTAFNHNAHFKSATFGGDTQFNNVAFTRNAWFDNAIFRANVRFKNAVFAKTIEIFDTARFVNKSAALKDALFAEVSASRR